MVNEWKPHEENRAREINNDSMFELIELEIYTKLWVNIDCVCYKMEGWNENKNA